MSALKHLRLPLLSVILASPAAAQSVNVDIGLNTVFPVPSSTYGAAAAQPGSWNGVTGSVVGPVALVGLNGSPSGVSLSRSGLAGDFSHDNGGTTADDDSLMDDCQDLGGAGSGSTTWTFTGLANGQYQVYTYAWAPDDGTYRTSVTVAGSGDPAQIVGGDWPGSHVQGTTFALHTVDVVAGTISVTAMTAADPVFGFGSLNGIQIKNVPPPITAYCFGDGSIGDCPCGNNSLPGAGKGCENSISTGGAHLTWTGTGTLSADNLVLTVTGERPTSLTIFWQGATSLGASPLDAGDGLRCMSGTLKRIYTKTASGGTAIGPGAGDPSISARSAALGDPIAPGQTRYYNTYYRDGLATFCPEPIGSAFNVSNGLTVPWN